MNSKGQLILSTIGVAAGCLTALGGFKLACDGINELEDTVYDFKADKFDVYEASGEAVVKTVVGIALCGIGGTVAGSSVACAFDAGQNSVIEAAKAQAPVQIAAKSIDEAQKFLDAMKVLEGTTTE